MRFVIQRVSEASVTVDGQVAGKIGWGFLVLIGVEHDDNEEIADKMVRKLLGMRIFRDDDDKINRSLSDIDGSLLLVSQFTLYADCKKGNRPSFTRAAGAEQANHLYEYIIARCRESEFPVETGIFGAGMHVHMINEGPFTVILDSAELG